MVSEELSLPRLEQLAWDFFYANKHKQFVGVRHFIDQVSRAITDQKLAGRSMIPDDLLVLMAESFCIEVEGKTTALRHSRVFSLWYSDFPSDIWFGAKGLSSHIQFKGFNNYLNLLGSSEKFMSDTLSQLQVDFDSGEPTRVVLVGAPNNFQQVRHDKRFIELAKIETQVGPQLSFVLALNKESMVMDPISWSSFTFKLREWADACSYKLAIPDLTMALFQERSLPIHQPRLRFSRCMPKSQVYSFFEEIPQFKKNMGCTHPSISPSASGLLSKINRFNRSLLMLGILPNQLRSLAKKAKMEHVEESLVLLSDGLFWEGYELWKKRKSLVKNFWQNIAPKEWKMNQTKAKKGKEKRKLKKNCKNPFHFCVKISDFSKQRRTICACSDTRRRIVSQAKDIRYFLTAYPKRVAFDHNLGSSHSRLRMICPSKNFEPPLTRRRRNQEEHDRGKNKKWKKDSSYALALYLVIFS